jgi:hypothetical protein
MTVTQMKFKDENDGQFEEAETITITTLENGYLVKVSYEEDEKQFVYKDKYIMLEEIADFL